MRRSDGTLKTLREQLPWPDDKPFRILSIDGGGIRGILPAKVLAELERRYLNGRCVGDCFDLIAGTSTGGIIALALSIGIPASRILDLYIQHGGEIFPPLPKWFRGPRRFARCAWGTLHYLYEREPLEARLREVFGEALIGDARRRLCIPTFDGFTEVNVFKTPHHRDFQKDWKEQMVVAALATAAAPTFFPIYKDGNRHFGDGGVWAADPAMIGLVDALTCYALKRRQVHILSLGCGDTEMIMTKSQIARGGMWHWRSIISTAMHLQSQNALGQAGLLIGRDQLSRINASASAGKPIEMDDYETARDELPPIGVRLVDEFGDECQARFLSSEADPYEAFYGPRSPATSHIAR